jgi:hypothetical protein
MENKGKRNDIKDERIEDVTMYGEFISSFDQWITPDNQRKNARHLEEASKDLMPDAKNNKKSK